MSNCNSCNSCNSKEKCSSEPKIKYSTKCHDLNMHDLMQPISKPKQDGSDLVNQCQHYTFGVIQRYQCEECIKEWVAAKEDYQVESQIEIMYIQKKNIAADRIKQALREKQHKRRIP